MTITITLSIILTTSYLTVNSNNQTYLNTENIEHIQFSFIATFKGEPLGTAHFSVKNLRTENLMMRAETLDFGQRSEVYFTFLIDGTKQKIWHHDGTNWSCGMPVSEVWNDWNEFLYKHITPLSGWSGEKHYVVTDKEGIKYNYYGITINPSLSEAIFDPYSFYF